MSSFLAAGLLLGAFFATSGEEIEHRVRIDHASGPIDAQYRSKVHIAHRQIGSAASAGKSSTLRCAWRANIAVEREARHASGSTLSRSLNRDGIIAGSRPGWCSTGRAAIAREVAARVDELRGHLVQVAEDDHPVLHGEIERMRSAG